MKWTYIQQLLEYFDDYSDETFKDLVDHLESLSPEDIDNISEQIKNKFSREFFDAYIEFVIEFSKFERSIQEQGGLTNNKYSTVFFTHTDSKKEDYMMPMIPLDVSTAIENFINNNPLSSQLFSKKFKVQFFNLLNQTEQCKKVFRTINDKQFVFNINEIQKNKKLITTYIDIIKTFQTVDYDEIINEIPKDTNYNVIHALKDFNFLLQRFDGEIVKILRSSTMYLNNIHTQPIISAYKRLSNVKTTYVLSHIMKKIYSIFWILTADLFKDINNEFDNPYDDMTNLELSQKKIKMLRQIEQICIDIAEEMDIM